MTLYATRDGGGNINGVYANPQNDPTNQAFADNDPAVVAYLTPNPVPQSVTPRQARLVLLGAGLLDQVDTMITGLGGATKITWDYASEIRREDPLILQLSASLNLTSDQIDQMFIQAATL